MSSIIGVPNSARLQPQVALAALVMADRYAAKTGDKPRRVMARLEHGRQGANPRFLVTDQQGTAKALCERRDGARGEAENLIEEAQLDLFGRRASWPRHIR